MTNGPQPTPLQQLLAELRIRIVSDEGVVPYRFEVQGLEMSEGYFRHFLSECWPGVTVEMVVAAVKAKRKR